MSWPAVSSTLDYDMNLHSVVEVKELLNACQWQNNWQIINDNFQALRPKKKNCLLVHVRPTVICAATVKLFFSKKFFFFNFASKFTNSPPKIKSTWREKLPDRVRCPQTENVSPPQRHISPTFECTFGTCKRRVLGMRLYFNVYQMYENTQYRAVKFTVKWKVNQ